jgi:hypothetical protein
MHCAAQAMPPPPPAPNMAQHTLPLEQSAALAQATWNPPSHESAHEPMGMPPPPPVKQHTWGALQLVCPQAMPPPSVGPTPELPDDVPPEVPPEVVPPLVPPLLV